MGRGEDEDEDAGLMKPARSDARPAIQCVIAIARPPGFAVSGQQPWPRLRRPRPWRCRDEEEARNRAPVLYPTYDLLGPRTAISVLARSVHLRHCYITCFLT
jgi:hypothetical protein